MSTPPATEPREPLCDSCDERRALVYCRADDARLCLSCDHQVHAANAVSSRHLRCLLCDVCVAAPSSILCSTDRQLLCHNCDFDAHERDIEGIGVSHERRPVEPYSGCPTASELLGVLGVGEDDKCLGLDGDGSAEMWERVDWCAEDNGGSLLLWEAPPVMSLDDLIVPTSARHRYQAVGVPPPPKDRNISCGKHKDEIIRQLRSMVEPEINFLNQFTSQEQCIGFQHIVAHKEFQSGKNKCDTISESRTIGEPCYEGKFEFFNHSECQGTDADTLVSFSSHLEQGPQEQNYLLSHDGVSDSQSQQNLDDGNEVDPEEQHVITPGLVHVLSVAERDSAISRYREKRKTRRYDKHVRYESRKARAETRTRIKGRFARIINRDAKQ